MGTDPGGGKGSYRIVISEIRKWNLFRKTWLDCLANLECSFEIYSHKVEEVEQAELYVYFSSLPSSSLFPPFLPPSLLSFLSTMLSFSSVGTE